MTRILLLSDTHHHLESDLLRYAESCDEIWHGGDFGNIQLAEQLQAIRPLKGVYGNIDGQDVRSVFPEINCFACEDVKVLMIHIGGYPGRYAPGVKQQLIREKAGLFISGHSHILKVQFDPAIQCLHMNPGAAGNQGWHQVKTALRFVIDGSQIRDCEVIELGRRGSRQA